MNAQLACVKEHLACPICIGILTETHITHCGHRFCKDCILECINRKPICPCCNAHLRPDMVLKDPLFDNLVGNCFNLISFELRYVGKCDVSVCLVKMLSVRMWNGFYCLLFGLWSSRVSEDWRIRSREEILWWNYQFRWPVLLSFFQLKAFDFDVIFRIICLVRKLF